jgi:hypothetical protein
MALKYYPLSRIKTNLYTRGDTFATEDGKPYTGRYYLTFDNKAFTGVNPVLGENKLLLTFITDPIHSETVTLAATRNNTRDKVLNSTYYAAATAQDINSSLLTELIPYYPTPIDSDYQLGYFTRYFAKNVSGPGYIIEVSPSDYANIQNNTNPDSYLVYESTSILWQLTGPLKDTRISQYQIKGGVYDTNKRVTEQKALTFRGLIEFIGGEYTKFAKITPDPVATSGSM